MNPLAGMDMGRILLELSDEAIKWLNDLEVLRNLPCADLLREAIEQYMENQSQTAISRVSGIWQSMPDAAWTPYPAYKALKAQYIVVYW